MRNRQILKRAGVLVLSAALFFPTVQTGITAWAEETETNYDVQFTDADITAVFHSRKATLTMDSFPLTGADRSRVKVRATAKIGSVTYYSDYVSYSYYSSTSFTISYPQQTEGTAVTYYLEDNAGHKGSEKQAQITKPALDTGEVSVYTQKARIFTDTFPLYDSENPSKKVRAAIKTDSAVYYSAYKARYDTDDGRYNFTVNYDAALTAGSSVTYYFEDEDGNTSESATATAGAVRFPEATEEFALQKSTVMTTEFPISNFERVKLGVKIGDDTYYSSYQTYNKYSNSYNFSVEYPIQQQGTAASWWFEDADGISTETKTATIAPETVDVKDAVFYNNRGQITTNGFPFDDSCDEVRAAVSIGGQTYYSDYEENRYYGTSTFTVTYPDQPKDTPLTYWLEGKDYGNSPQITSQITYLNASVKKAVFNATSARVTTNGFPSDDDHQKMRLVVSIGDERYYSGYSDGYDYDGYFSINYEKTQKNGASVTYWFEGSDYGRSDDYTGTVGIAYKLKMPKVSAVAAPRHLTVKASRSPLSGSESSLAKVRLVAEINGKQYNTGYKNNTVKTFTVEYPKKAWNTRVRFYFEDDQNGAASAGKTTTIKNRKPKIKYSKNNSDSVILKGSTSKKSQVTVKYRGKTRKTSSTGSGRYRVNTGRLAAGTTVKVRVVTPDGFYNTKKFRIKQAKGKVSLGGVTSSSTSVNFTAKKVKKGDYLILKAANRSSRYRFTSDSKKKKGSIALVGFRAGTQIRVTYYDRFGGVKGSTGRAVRQAVGKVVLPNYTVRYSRKVNFRVWRVTKGDYLTLRIGSRNYRYNFNANAAYRSGTISIYAPATGSQMYATLHDRFGGVKATYRDKVYYDSVIRVGMTVSQLKQTTLGLPDDINRYSYGDDQWCYDRDGDGFDDFFVYVKGNKVTAWQDI